MHMCLATQIADRHTALKANIAPMACMHVCTHNGSLPLSCWAQTLNLPSNCWSLDAILPVAGTWRCEPLRLQHHCSYQYRLYRSQTRNWPGLPWCNSLVLETSRCSDTLSWPLESPTPLFSCATSPALQLIHLDLH